MRYQQAYRKYGFHCAGGRLRKGKGTTAGAGSSEPPYTPPPPPLFQPGHYKGQTSQNENFEFDVTADSLGVQGLKTGQINLGCDPPAHLWNYGFNFGSYVTPIAADASFTIDYGYQSWIDFGDSYGQSPTSDHLSIMGHLTGSIAVGNLQLRTIFTHAGTPYSCGSGLQTWTATRIG